MEREDVRGGDSGGGGCGGGRASSKGRRRMGASLRRRDMRWELQHCLASYMRYLLRARYSRDKGLGLCKALTNLSLLSMECPIRNPHDLQCVPGLGAAWVAAAKSQLKKKRFKSPAQQEKPFVLAAPAFLVALLDAQEEALAQHATKDRGNRYSTEGTKGDDGQDEAKGSAFSQRRHTKTGNYLVEGDTVLVPLKELVRRAAPLCEEAIPDLSHHPDIHDLPAKRTKKGRSDASGQQQQDPVANDSEHLASSIALRRLDNLSALGFVKKRQRRNQPVYQLTDTGVRGTRILNPSGVYVPQFLGAAALREKAQLLRHVRQGARTSHDDIALDSLAPSAASVDTGRREASSSTGTHSHVSDTTNSSSTCGEASGPSATHGTFLHGNDEAWQCPAVVLLVDTREGGGRYHLLKEMCAALHRLDVTFRTETLAIADYGWKHRLADGTEKVLPVLVERKRVDDLSDSLADGRFESQCARMLQARDTFPGTELHYIVEGTYSAYRVNTCCARGCIGKHGQATQTDIETYLASLRAKQFTVHRTATFHETAAVLSRLHTRLSLLHLAGADVEQRQEQPHHNARTDTSSNRKPQAATKPAASAPTTATRGRCSVVDLTDEGDGSLQFGEPAAHDKELTVGRDKASKRRAYDGSHGGGGDDEDDDDDGYGDDELVSVLRPSKRSRTHVPRRQQQREQSPTCDWQRHDATHCTADTAGGSHLDDSHISLDESRESEGDRDLIVLDDVEDEEASQSIFAHLGSTRAF